MESGSQAKLEHAVLSCYYHNLKSLHAYISACLPNEIADSVLLKATDEASYVSLLEDTRVAWNSTTGAPKPLAYESSSQVTSQWILRRAQRELLLSNRKASNVLCFGYKLVSTNSQTTIYAEPVMQVEGNLVNTVSNSTLTDFEESRDWKLLLSRC
jgi:hypothetical protein